ncbi:MAG: fused MFS/spermidine synthase [Candidatus Caldarchaeum sp.]|nr:fused MFS/spermidine synthase [Candidatus Caldarchaeum sp.]
MLYYAAWSLINVNYFPASSSHGLKNLGLAVLVVLSGAVVMCVEMAASRLLAPVFGNTIFVWGSLIGVVLTALSAGYVLGGRLADRVANIKTLAAIVFTGGLLTFSIPYISPMVLEAVAEAGLDERFGPLVSTALLIAPPTIPLGMVSPYAIKLLSTIRSRVGSSAGDVYSLSTVGSIAGTFITVFILIPSLDVRTVILSGGALLMAVSALYLSKMSKLITLALFMMVLTPAGYLVQSVAASGGEVVYVKETLYNSLVVVRQDEILTLYLNGLPHSAASVKNPYSLVFPYTRFFELGPALSPNATNALFVGGGGFSGPKYFLKNYPNIRVDVVELDPDVVDAARRFFMLPEDSRLRVFVEDGRTFLQRGGMVYDVVVMDAYAKTYFPFHLMTLEFYRLVRQRMSDDGVLVINLIASLTGDTSEIFWSEYKTVGEVFEKLFVFKASEFSGGSVQNLILVACASASCSLDGVEARVKDSWLAAKVRTNLWTAIPSLEEYTTLTDGYAPVERMINPVTGKPYSVELEGYGGSLPTLFYAGSNAFSLTAVFTALAVWFLRLFWRNP